MNMQGQHNDELLHEVKKLRKKYDRLAGKYEEKKATQEPKPEPPPPPQPEQPPPPPQQQPPHCEEDFRPPPGVYFRPRISLIG
jgi:hypothetical protein